MPSGASEAPGDILEAVRAVETRSSATADLPPLSAGAHGAAKKALSLLAVRPRSAHELRQRLLGAEHEAEAVDEAVDRLRAWELLDDADFAREWVRGRRSRRGKAAGALRAELQAKGVADRHIDAALAEIDVSDEFEKATELIRGRLERRAARASSVAPGSPDHLREKRRLVSFLERRGFTGGLAMSVVDAELSAHPGAGAAD